MSYSHPFISGRSLSGHCVKTTPKPFCILSDFGLIGLYPQVATKRLIHIPRTHPPPAAPIIPHQTCDFQVSQQVLIVSPVVSSDRRVLVNPLRTLLCSATRRTQCNTTLGLVLTPQALLKLFSHTAVQSVYASMRDIYLVKFDVRRANSQGYIHVRPLTMTALTEEPYHSLISDYCQS